MPGHTKTTWSLCTLWLLGLLSIGSSVAQQQAAAAPAQAAVALPAEAPLATDPLSITPTSQGPALCRVNIKGTPTGNISAASMVCSGGTSAVTVAAEKLLSGFKQRFQGVVWDDRCGIPGCLLTFCGLTQVVVMDSSIDRINSRHIDAVVCAADTTVLTLQRMSVAHNNATALVALNQSRVVVAATRIAYNVGSKYNGGVFAGGDAALDIQDNSEVVGNVALSVSGGGVRVRGYARATITGESRILNNTSAFAGGGVALLDDAKLVVGGGSSIRNNTGSAGGGGLGATDRAHVIIRGASSVSYNKAANGTGGGVAIAREAQLIITGGSSVHFNRGRGGGGLIVSDKAQVTITGASTVFNNTSDEFSGGGVGVVGHALLDISGGSSVCRNWAGSSGGGLHFGGNSTARITDATICNNTCSGHYANGGAGLVISEHASVYIVTAQIVGNWVNYSSGGAINVGMNGNLTLGPGVVLADNSVDVGYVGESITTYQASSLYIDPGASVNGRPLTKCDRSIYLGRLPCQEGEYEASGICQCCPEHQYSFTAGVSSCQPCPENAHCPGATRVLPKPGYYHSAECSVQIHACPIASACRGSDTCADGHTGNLCGSCAKGYGQTLPLRCRKCMPTAQQFGVYVLLMFVTVVLITLNVHFTWQDNKAGDKAVRPSDLCKVLAQFLQYLVILGSMSVRWPKFLTGMFAAATVVFGGASGQALSLDCWLSNYVPQKQLPLAVQRQLALFGVSVGILLAVMLLMSCVHIFRRVINVLRCGGVFRWRVSQLWRKLRVAVLVVAFYAYPTLVKASLSFFACLRIDDKSKQPYPEFAVLNHTAGYWVQDIQQECFAGWHKPWALGFGIPAITSLCLIVPIGLWLFLWAKKESITDAGFREQYSFLYRDYTDRWVWWEAVWAVQTVLLTAVSVFHFMLQAYYALFAMCLVLLLSAGLQLMARPYAQKELHRLHLTSTLCLFFNAWLSFALFDDAVDAREETLRPLHNTIGVVLIVLNICFIFWCVCKIVKSVAPTVMQLVMGVSTKAKVLWQDCHGIVCSTAGSRVRAFKQRTRPVERDTQREASSPVASVASA